MRLSRLATGTVVLVAILSVVVNPGCSSSGGSGFSLGPDGGVLRDGSRVGPDGRVLTDSSLTDAPIKLGMMADSADAPQKMISNEAGFNDAKVKVDASACVEDAGGPAPLAHTCIIYPAGDDDNNECDGHHDPPSPFPSNGTTGNGFDDNCNGLVDEGCACDAVGTTKPCYLVPATQAMDGLPVGWCATNSVGTVACAPTGESGAAWNGTCRGAQPPYASDVCAPGDFNCDGKPENPPGGCHCQQSAITCPTAPVTTVPYPPTDALPLRVDAASWFSDASQVSMATNWQWSMTGGDCDNILPNPTFGIYPTPNGTKKQVSTASTTLGMSGKEHGEVATGAELSAAAGDAGLPASPWIVYPAFSLSGDYVLTASWELAGQPYTCTLQVQVRAPGLRAEACWSTEADGDDLDLHMAKVNGFTTQCPNELGWSDISCPNADEDCYYAECYSADVDSVKWGYPSSPASSCNGWGSQTTGTGQCGNPRLDRDANGDSGTCDPSVVNPNGALFCGPENINLDKPNDGDEFAVAVRVYNKSSSPPARTHADIYCNGARVFAGGYDPIPNASGEVNIYPQLIQPGQDGDPAEDEGGDMWKVALVTTNIGDDGTLNCTVVPTQSKTPNATKDGSTAYCVDNGAANGANSQVFLTSGGGVPADANAMCFH